MEFGICRRSCLFPFLRQLIIVTMASIMFNNFTVPQISQLVAKATKDRANLDEIVLRKLDKVGEVEVAFENAKKEIEVHRKIETTRQDMETELGKLEDEIRVLEAKKQDKRAIYEQKLRKFREVSLTCYVQPELILPFRS